MSEPRVGHRVKATDGLEYEFFVDQYSRRWWRSVEDPSRLEPYAVVEAPPPEAPRAGGYDEEAWLRSWNAYNR